MTAQAALHYTARLSAFLALPLVGPSPSPFDALDQSGEHLMVGRRGFALQDGGQTLERDEIHLDRSI